MNEHFENVWDAIESPEEAAKLKACSDLMVQIEEIIRQKGWGEDEAAKHFHTTPDTIASILSGHIDRVRVEDLLAMTGALGRKVRVEIEAA